MEDRGELTRLVSALCDEQLREEQLSEAEWARLEEMLAGDEEARRFYLQYVDLHARLLTHPNIRGASELGGVEAVAGLIGEQAAVRHNRAPQARTKPRRGRSLEWVSYVAVAAATLAATVLVQFFVQHREPRHEPNAAPAAQAAYVATLWQAVDAEWGAETEAYVPGTRMLAGEVSLRRGIARLAYDGGVELIVEGPARLKLENGSAAALIAGKVVFRGDDVSAPFTLTTPASILVDIGTEYAVDVGESREEVHVFSGEVQRLPKDAPRETTPELLAAGEARRYSDATPAKGEVAVIEPGRFVRQMPAGEASRDVAAGLLAHEGFAYADAAALREEMANGGSGFAGPWGGGFARAVNDKRDDQLALNPVKGLVRAGSEGASVGGAFEHVGFAKYFRRLSVPVRLDTDGVYYLSCLFRREGPPLDPLNSVSIQLRETEELAGDQADGTIDLRKRLNFGFDKTNELFTHLERIGRRTPLPMNFGETYLLAAKVVASSTHPDQVFLRVYGPQEPVDREEPASWSAAGPPVHSDLVFDWLEIHINSHTRQTIDEIRLGTTWGAVAAPWSQARE